MEVVVEIDGRVAVAWKDAHQIADARTRRLVAGPSATNIPSTCRMELIALDDATILPYDANPGRMEFSERTRGGGANSPRIWCAQ